MWQRIEPWPTLLTDVDGGTGAANGLDKCVEIGCVVVGHWCVRR